MIASLIALIMLASPLVGFDDSALERCIANANDSTAFIECQRLYGGGGANDPTDPDDPSDPGSLIIYSYMWLPACPGTDPLDPDAASMSCVAMQTCTDPGVVRLTLWSKQLTDADGNPTNAGWRPLLAQCREPGDIGEVGRQLTWQDVLTAIRRVGVPTAHIEVPAYTLVNLPTTVYTHPTTVDRTLTILGYTVDVHLQPTTYTWHFDDGHTTTTHTPGHPWPATDITHTWTHATTPHHPTNPSVDTTYTATYRVDGGDWTTIPDTITTTGPTTTLPIRQATAVLVH